MEDDFVILHLSDTHIGNPKFELNSSTVFNPLYQDIEKTCNQGLHPNLIIFSGDLGYGELNENPLNKQFKIANEWITNIYSSIGLPFTQVPFLIVPGNHDMDRLHRDGAHDAWIEGLINKDTLYEHMRDNSITWKNIIKRQQAWTEFVKGLDEKHSIFDENLNMSTMIIKHGYHNIGIVGINSSWASYKDKQDSRLWIGHYQIEKAVEKLRDCDFKIAVSHHPTSCFHDEERIFTIQKLETNFQVHLHGHIHDQWYTDSNRHLKVAAGSCYQGADKENAYSWIKLNFAQGTGQISFRKYEEKGEGGWIPYEIPGRTNSNGIGQIQHLFAQKGDGSGPRKGIKKSTSLSEGISEPPYKFSDLKTYEEYIEVLKDRFSFRWEPHNFDKSKENVKVYWPVRLRQPTPIHAIQCFAAAGLTKLGAKVVLYLDDLGNKEASKEDFYAVINRWFEKVGGKEQLLELRLCSDTISSSTDVWQLLQGWFASSQVTLKEVFLISKLLRDEEYQTIKMQELVSRKPRRLMTPAIVWACLANLHQEDPSSGFLTLGGYDEKKLWDTWRRRANQTQNIALGHLYVPELYTPESSQSENIRMGDSSLKLDWDAEEDIKTVLKLEIERTQPPDLYDPHRIISWCFSGCYLLPSFIADKDPTLNLESCQVTSLDDLKKVNDPMRLISPLAKLISTWLL